MWASQKLNVEDKTEVNNKLQDKKRQESPAVENPWARLGFLYL